MTHALGAWSILSPLSVSARIPVGIKDVCVYLLMTKQGAVEGSAGHAKREKPTVC